MAKTYPIQQSFSAGEISPKLLARTDLPGYKHSCSELLNMIPAIQGPVFSRFGFELIDRAASLAEQYARMIPFHVSFVEEYVVIITTDTVYIADRNGFQPSGNLVLNNDFGAAGADWNVLEPGGASVSFGVGTCLLTSNGSNAAAIWQAVTTPLADIGLVHRIYYDGVGAGDDVRVLVGTAQGLGDILDVLLSNDRDEALYTPGVENYFVQWQTEGGDVKLLDNVGAFTFTQAADFVQFPNTVWNTPLQVEEIQFEVQPGGIIMYLAQRDAPIQRIRYVDAHTWVFEPAPIIGSTFEVGVNLPWGDSHPGCLTFFKGRMYVGGSRAAPATVWASRSLTFTNFAVQNPVDPDNPAAAMELPLDSYGDVEWLRGGKALFVGMDTGEHVIFGEGNTPPTASNVDSEQQGAFGSARVQGKLIGEKVAFVTPDRRKVYLQSYSRDALGWISKDVSYPSEHITAGLLREIELSGTPDQILWFPTLDGKLVGMSYDSRRDIIGWHAHETQGFVVSVTVIKNFGISELWIAVLRNGALLFERADFAYKLDSYVTEEVPNGGTQQVFPGFDHLEGLTVQVLADGAVHRDIVVGESNFPDDFPAAPGQIVLDYPAHEIAVGLGYVSRIRTLPVDMLTRDEGRTSFMKSWNKIFVRLLNSARPLIQGVRPPVRNEETPMGEREPYRTEDVEVADLGWDIYGIVTIEQDLPLRLEVAGIFGELDQETIE